MSRLFANGTTDTVLVASSATVDNLEARSTMVWVNLVSYGPFTDVTWFSKGTAGDLYAYTDISGGYYGAVNVIPTQAASQTVDGLPTLGVWTHLATTFDLNGDAKIRFYVNGVEVPSYSAQTAAIGALTDDSGKPWRVGQYPDDAGHDYTLDSYVYDFRIYNTNLDEAALAAIVAGGPSADPAPANLVCQLVFEDDNPVTEPDASGNNNDGAITGTAFSTDNPAFGGPVTVGAVFPGPYRGNTLAEAFANSDGQDILQIVNQGGLVIWNLSATGTASDNPGSPTDQAVLARLQGNSFAEAFRNQNDLNILQVVGPGGDVIFYVDFEGNAVTP